MDLWLSLFSDIKVGLLLARVKDKGIGVGVGSRFSLLGARAAMSAKDLGGASFSCLAVLALICFIPLLLCRTFISAY